MSDAPSSNVPPNETYQDTLKEVGSCFSFVCEFPLMNITDITVTLQSVSLGGVWNVGLPYCDIRHNQAAELSALRAGRTLPPRRFLLLQPEYTPPGIEHGTSRLVSQCLNQQRHRSPHLGLIFPTNTSLYGMWTNSLTLLPRTKAIQYIITFPPDTQHTVSITK